MTVVRILVCPDCELAVVEHRARYCDLCGEGYCANCLDVYPSGYCCRSCRVGGTE